MKIRSQVVIKNKSSKSKLNNELNGIGLIIEDTPKIRNVLNILDPIIFPTTKSNFFFIAATTDTINSGREVPIAKIVAEIRNSDRPKFLAIIIEESRTNFPPINKAIIPPRIIRVIIVLECFWGSNSSGNILSFCFFPSI